MASAFYGRAKKAEVGSGVLHEQPVPLSRLIDIVNERFDTDFNRPIRSSKRR